MFLTIQQGIVLIIHKKNFTLYFLLVFNMSLIRCKARYKQYNKKYIRYHYYSINV